MDESEIPSLSFLHKIVTPLNPKIDMRLVSEDEPPVIPHFNEYFWSFQELSGQVIKNLSPINNFTCSQLIFFANKLQIFIWRFGGGPDQSKGIQTRKALPILHI
jgi:hypothetical protein